MQKEEGKWKTWLAWIGLLLIFAIILSSLHYVGLFNRIKLSNIDPYDGKHFGPYPESGFLMLKTTGWVDSTKYYKAIVTPEESELIIRGKEVEEFDIARSAPLWFHIKETKNTKYYLTEGSYPDSYIYEPSTGEILVEINP